MSNDYEVFYNYYFQKAGEQHRIDDSETPTPRSFDDEVLDKHLTEKQRKEIDRRQALTGKVLGDILSGKFGM